VFVRNSILVSPALEPAVLCPSATIDRSVLEDTTGFPNNTELPFIATWFESYAQGNFVLSGTHPSEIETAATWQTGDPATDIAGLPRPTIDGTPDFAGAALIP